MLKPRWCLNPGLSFRRGAAKSTTQGVIFALLSLTTFRELISINIHEYHLKAYVIPHLLVVASPWPLLTLPYTIFSSNIVFQINSLGVIFGVIPTYITIHQKFDPTLKTPHKSSKHSSIVKTHRDDGRSQSMSHGFRRCSGRRSE